jgi:acyl transferase domain-containing protein
MTAHPTDRTERPNQQFACPDDESMQPVARPEPIAIVGIGCRFPGGVDSPDSFWRFLVEGREAVAEVPADRFDVEAIYDPRPAMPGKVLTRRGGFLDQLDRFDAKFFGISPREAEQLDPQQRLMLEVAWEALEDAGQPPDRLDGKHTGVYVGVWLSDQEARLAQGSAPFDFYKHTGSGRYFASGRVSYALGLEGPSLTLDTGCSSSLVAVHLACQSLRTGECDLALAGGVNVILQPHVMMALSQGGILSPDGRCKFGDARADGYVRSEGAAVVVLKPLAQAQADGDPIYAIIRGGAVSNDGRSSGFLATPGSAGQEETLRRAYQNAGVSPGSVAYVEAHGTGTRAGDPVELRAIHNVFSLDRPAGFPCLVGSHKTNFGHTEAAAGVAGLIKAALAVKYRMIPASLNFSEPNPGFEWAGSPIVIPSATVPWPAGAGAALAGVSSIGLAGTNAHFVLEEPPAPRGAHVQNDEGAPARPRLLTVSGHTPAARAEMAGRLQAFLDGTESAALALDDSCYTANVRRGQQEYRGAVVAHDRAGLSAGLAHCAAGEIAPGVVVGQARANRPNVAFVFAGQGAQWLGMGRNLLAGEPVFRAAIERCATALEPLLDDWSLIEELTADEAASKLERIDVQQPAVFAIQVALAALWRSWGIEPDAVVGHSLGEVAAAHVAGALSLEDACRVVTLRSRLLRRISGQGAMGVVGLSMEQARAALVGYEDRLSIGVSNSPKSTVLSGDPAALDEVMAVLRGRDVFCRLVKIDAASHSPQVEPLLAELAAGLATLKPQPARLPFYSTVTGALCAGFLHDGIYWTRNLRETVLFSTAVTQLLEDGYDVFLELSPHPILVQPVEATAHALGRTVQALPSLQRATDDWMVMLGSLGALHVAGCAIDWSQLYPNAGTVCALPTYAWQRERYWIDARPGHAAAVSWESVAGGEPAHDPLLGTRLPELAALPDSVAWQRPLDAGLVRKVLGQQSADEDLPATLPDAAYRELAMVAARARFGDRHHAVGSLKLREPLPLEPNGARTLQCLLAPAPDGGAVLQVFSRNGEHASWTRHAEAELSIDHFDPTQLYSLEWLQRDRTEAPHDDQAGAAAGSWLILGDRAGIGERLAERLGHRGAATVLIEAGDAFSPPEGDSGRYRVNPSRPADFDRLLEHLGGAHAGRCRGVVFLWGLDLPATESLSAATLQETQALGVGSLLHVTQALARAGWASAPRIWAVTRGAEGVAGETTLSVAQASLWGLGRVIGLEHTELWGGLIDLPAEGPDGLDASLDVLVAEFSAPDGEDQLAYRDGQRYVARLVHSTVQDELPRSPMLRADATYLVTGGTGSLGLELARWLVDRGARHLVLTSRSGLPERADWEGLPHGSTEQRRVEAVRALEARGATVTAPRIDVADASGMATLFSDLRLTHPPLRGVIHAAGTIDTRPVADLSTEALDEIMRPKVAGAWILHELTRDLGSGPDGLDFFVCFSSGAALWGAHGLAHYAAANHFLDALVQQRRRLGLPALSVNWGSWAGGGMATGALGADFEQAGLSAVPVESALAALGYLLGADATQQAVAAFDWPIFKPIYEARRRRPLIAEIEVAVPATASVEQERRSEFLERWEQALPSQRTGLLMTLVQSVAAGILGFAEPDMLDRTQGFFKQGMDSIMTVQLRSQLETSLCLPLPPTVAFEYPTVTSLAAFLASEILPGAGNGAVEAPAALDETGQEGLASPEARLEDLNTDDLLALFDREFETASTYAEKDQESR